MSNLDFQQSPLTGSIPIRFYQNNKLCDGQSFWDPVQARFSSCFLPFMSAIPAVIAVCILLGRILHHWLPYRPKWTKPFVKELIEEPGETPKSKSRGFGRLAAVLLAVSIAGFAAQIATVFYPTFEVSAINLAVSWALTGLLVAIYRPRCPQLSLLVLYIAIAISEVLIVLDSSNVRYYEILLPILIVMMAFGAAIIILCMPMRDPQLSNEYISPVYDVPTHHLRTPEDNLTLLQFLTVSWMSPLISVGKARQLNDEDVWSLGYEFQHRRLHDTFRDLQGSVVRRLLTANGLDLVTTSSLGILESLARFSVPVLMQQLLRSMEDARAPRSAAVKYAAITLAVRLIASQASVINLWFSRRSYERSRGEMITMLYEKTLSRKIVGAQTEPQTEDNSEEGVPNGAVNGNGNVKRGSSMRSYPKFVWKKFLRLFAAKRDNKVEEIKQAASMGKILNLMKNDVYEIAQRYDDLPFIVSPSHRVLSASGMEIPFLSCCTISLTILESLFFIVLIHLLIGSPSRFWEFPSLITKPLDLVLSIVLIWRFIGWPCILGIVTVLLAQGLNALLARGLVSWEKVRRVATDTKLQKISQFVEAIRHLRWYGWQDTWKEHIMEARQRELNLRIITGLWGMTIGFTNNFASDLFALAVFYAYTELAGQRLLIDVAFPALQLFRMLEASLAQIPGLITVLLNAYVAVGRLEDFMAEPNIDNPMSTGSDSMNLPPESDGPQPQLELNGVSVAWPGMSENVLHDINVTFPTGLTVVFGEVAAGKTALLQALLGELDQHGGEILRPLGTIGYCAQIPWLQSMSIRENILFSSPYEEGRYQRVLEACALITDMASFKHGDLSNIGENGIGLSGGQKARVALARALYSRAKILLLDDPLSALDHQTAETIVHECFGSKLLEDRITVLVTHRTELCCDLATQMIEISAGKARLIDPQTHPSFPTSHNDNLSRHSPDSDSSTQASRRTSEQGPLLEDTKISDLNDSQLSTSAIEGDLGGELVEPERTISNEITIGEADRERDEETELGDEPEKFMDDEHRAHGGVKLSVYWEYIKAAKLRWWFILICAIVIYRLIAVGQTWFLKSWGEAYKDSEEEESSDHWPALPPPQDNARPWLVGYFLLSVAQAAAFLVWQGIMIVLTYSAGRQMFERVLSNVAHATFRYYDTTPVGRLMNRLTSDISTIDGNISNQFKMAAFLSIAWVSSVVVIASVTPVFLAFSFTLTVVFVLIFLQFLPTSQSLRRLEMVSLSPLMSNFGALLDGLTTVRAFCAQARFQDRVIAVTDAFQKMDHFYWSLQAWLMYRFDALSACSTFLLTMLALYTGLSPGLTAFVLIAASQFVSATHYLCKQYGQLQMDFVSVERVVELLYLEQESAGHVNPPAWWPSLSGDILFEDVTIRYAPHLETSLSNLSLSIKAGCSTAIIGRTGSGKSTLALTLLATVTPESGRILIDGLDISTVDKQALRQRVTFLAQEPVLFPGSMRQNLDPLEEYTDSACEAVLAKICGRHQWTLTTQIERDGKNFSQGQRQLVGLARALLRRSAIVILDEATASIDLETSMEIQRVLHEEMQGSTVITIAHRLEAVKNAEYCIVLDKGKLVEQGRAADMLGNGDGRIAELVQT